MSAAGPIQDPRDCRDEAAAWALGALEDAEARRFGEHAAGCVVCRDELEAFEAVAGALAMAVPQQPLPRDLRRRVLADVRADARAHELTGQRARRKEVTQRRLARRPSPGAPRRRWLAAGAALAALALASAGVLEVSQAPSTSPQIIHASVAGQSGGAQAPNAESAIVRLTGGHAELIVSHLDPPPAGQIYQVWLGRSHGSPTPTSALFTPNAMGNGDFGVPGNLHGVSKIIVTQEPNTGTQEPTTQPLIVARLPHR